MKILQVTHRYPPRTGGVETHVGEIATRLVDRGHEVTVFSADAGGDLDGDNVRDGVHVRRFRSVAPGGAIHVAPQVAPAVRRAEVDVVHAHNYHSLPLAFAALGVRDARFVVTPHYHGESASGVRDRLLSTYRPLGRWTLGRADAVIAVSEWEREQLQADFGVEATVIPNGLNTCRFRSADPHSRERPYLLTVGRLEAYKGIQHVIRALEELPDYDLVVAGSGPYREELDRIANAEGVDHRVHFLGYVDEKSLPALYAGADVYVSMSELEAYGMTVAEALASGTPSVVRNEAALSEWTEFEGCVSVRSARPADIATAIRNARERSPNTASIPDWDTVVDRLLAQYRGG